MIMIVITMTLVIIIVIINVIMLLIERIIFMTMAMIVIWMMMIILILCLFNVCTIPMLNAYCSRTQESLLFYESEVKKSKIWFSSNIIAYQSRCSRFDSRHFRGNFQWSIIPWYIETGFSCLFLLICALFSLAEAHVSC